MNNSASSRIIAVQVRDDYVVELKFGDGFIGQIDLKPQLWGPVFEPLLSPDIFQQVRVDDETIRWPTGADFAPDVLRFWRRARSGTNRSAFC